jgi:hypothetical protein
MKTDLGPLGVLVAGACATVGSTPLSSPLTWQPQGTVLSASSSVDLNSVLEPSVVYDGKFRMWFTCDVNVCYAESMDGKSWQRDSGWAISNHVHGYVLKNQGQYYFFGASLEGHTQTIDMSTSVDGRTWQSPQPVLRLAKTSWDSIYFGNNAVWVEDAGLRNQEWKMLYEALTPRGWSLGLAISDGGRIWIRASNNPVLVGFGGPMPFKRANGTYIAWVHSAAFLPSDIYRTTSTDLIHWTKPILDLARATPDEGVGSLVGQVADAQIVGKDYVTYLFYTATPDGSDEGGGFHIKLARINRSLDYVLKMERP